MRYCCYVDHTVYGTLHATMQEAADSIPLDVIESRVVHLHDTLEQGHTKWYRVVRRLEGLSHVEVVNLAEKPF